MKLKFKNKILISCFFLSMILISGCSGKVANHDSNEIDLKQTENGVQWNFKTQ